VATLVWWWAEGGLLLPHSCDFAFLFLSLHRRMRCLTPGEKQESKLADKLVEGGAC